MFTLDEMKFGARFFALVAITSILFSLAAEQAPAAACLALVFGGADVALRRHAFNIKYSRLFQH